MSADQYLPSDPVGVERALKDVSDRIARAPKVLEKLDNEMSEAKRVLKRAEAQALLRYTDGIVAEREARVTLATLEEQEAYDLARVAYQYAKNQFHSLRDRLSSLQTQSSLIRMHYGSAGRGEF